MDSNVELILGIVGVALCLGGWVLFYLGSRLLGIGIGLGFGFAFGVALSMVLKLPLPGQQLVLLSCSLLGAIGGFFFVRMATSFLFALVGFLFGAMLGRVGAEIYAGVMRTAYIFDTHVAIAVAVTGAVFAVLAILLQKLIVIIITSFVGATFLTAALPWAVGREAWFVFGLFLGSSLWQAALASQLGERGNSRPAEEE